MFENKKNGNHLWILLSYKTLNLQEDPILNALFIGSLSFETLRSFDGDGD